MWFELCTLTLSPSSVSQVMGGKLKRKTSANFTDKCRLYEAENLSAKTFFCAMWPRFRQAGKASKRQISPFLMVILHAAHISIADTSLFNSVALYICIYICTHRVKESSALVFFVQFLKCRKLYSFDGCLW